MLKRADFAQTRRMVPVEEGELIVELALVPAARPAAHQRSLANRSSVQYAAPDCLMKLRRNKGTLTP